MTALVVLVVCACSVPAFVIVANRVRRPDFDTVDVTSPDNPLAHASGTLSILTWNIGYAALGKNADFFADKGTSLRALPKSDIATATSSITKHLEQMPVDVICLQEIAGAGFLTRGVPVRARIARGLQMMRQAYWADLKTVFAPSWLRLDHGMAVFTRLNGPAPTILALPQPPSYYFGFIKKYYVAQVSRYPIGATGRDWVVFNLHLSAFDAGGAVRAEQLVALMAAAKAEYANGHYVVIGGDWNMRLAVTDFPHSTNLTALDWLFDLPKDVLPAGWQIAVDPVTPTVRTMQTPYRVGQNYTAVIDGFVISPNLRMRSVLTHDLGFTHTDHHPVEAVFEINHDKSAA